jgi:ribosomal protein S12 methylthiotransferase
MKSNSKLVPYLDIPMQHISASVLKRMRRAGTQSRLERIFRTARQQMPETALRTTLILGHPGETEEDFRELYNFVREIRFDRLGTFVYSDEDSTHAFDQNQKVSTSVAKKRQHQIMELQREISLAKNRELIGSPITVLLDEYNAEQNIYIGRTYRDAPEIDNEVIISGKKDKKIEKGEFVSVSVKDATEYELYA